MTPLLATYIAMAVGAAGLYLILPGAQNRFRTAGLLALAGSLAALLILFGDHLTTAAGGAHTVFYLLSGVTLIAAVKVITHRRAVYAVLYFVVVILASAGLVLLQNAQFLAVALVLIYAGAIIVTYVFVIMLAQPAGLEECDRQSREPMAAVILGFVFCATLTGVALRAWPEVNPIGYGPAATELIHDKGQVAAVGWTLLTDFPVALEVAGLLLLVAMVGAVVIATKPGQPSADQSSKEASGG